MESRMLLPCQNNLPIGEMSYPRPPHQGACSRKCKLRCTIVASTAVSRRRRRRAAENKHASCTTMSLYLHLQASEPVDLRVEIESPQLLRCSSPTNSSRSALLANEMLRRCLPCQMWLCRCISEAEICPMLTFLSAM